MQRVIIEEYAVDRESTPEHVSTYHLVCHYGFLENFHWCNALNTFAGSSCALLYNLASLSALLMHTRNHADFRYRLSLSSADLLHFPVLF